MDSSGLKREVVIPPPRESAAAVALISALALVGALATTAFAVRTRHVVHPLRCGPMMMAEPSSAQAEADFLRLTEAVEDDAALAAWLALPPGGRARTSDHRELVARRMKARELDLLTMEIDRGNCPAISERLSRLQTLLPDHVLPTSMAFCEP